MKKDIQSGKKPIVMLHVFPSFGFGGQQSRFAALSAGLGPDYRHQVVALDENLSARGLLNSSAAVEAEAMPVGKSTLAGIVNYWRFRRLFGKIKPDILCTYNWGSIEAVLANRAGPQIPHVHFEDGFGPGETVETQHYRRVKARRLLLGKAHIVVPSVGLQKTALEKWNVEENRLHLIANGVDIARFQRQRGGLRTAVTIGSIGALRPEKNYARLISAFAKADRDGKARLKIIGDGTEHESLMRAIKTNPTRTRMMLAGATATPEAAYNDFDVFALSSDTEQAPLVIMEAMAAGLPVAATNVGSVAGMVASENRAFITPLGDDRAYIDALSHLLQNPDARASIGAANRKKAKAEFGAAAMVKKHRRLYESFAVAGRR